jgi:hypothetical protein
MDAQVTSNLLLAGGASAIDSLLQVLQPGVATGRWNIYCIVPPGESSYAWISLSRTPANSNVTLVSPPSFWVDYLPPIITSISVWSSVSNSWTTYLISPTASPPTVYIPSAGTIVQINGTNLGTDPSLFIADNWVYWIENTALALTPCDNAYGCYQFSSPPGEGNGLTYSSAGFSVRLEADNQVSNIIPVSYAGGVVTSVTASAPSPLDPSSTFPTRGGTLITVQGYNFGITNHYRDPSATTITVSFGRDIDGTLCEPLVVARYQLHPLIQVLTQRTGWTAWVLPGCPMHRYR